MLLKSYYSLLIYLLLQLQFELTLLQLLFPPLFTILPFEFIVSKSFSTPVQLLLLLIVNRFPESLYVLFIVSNSFVSEVSLLLQLQQFLQLSQLQLFLQLLHLL